MVVCHSFDIILDFFCIKCRHAGECEDELAAAGAGGFDPDTTVMGFYCHFAKS